jgi:hypothetical protein
MLDKAEKAEGGVSVGNGTDGPERLELLLCIGRA